MKYVRQTRGTLGFNRHYPTHLQATIGRNTFTYPLGSADQSPASLAQAWSRAMETFDAAVEQATNSNSDDFMDAKVELLVERKLKTLKKNYGALANFEVPQHIIDFYEQDKELDASTTLAAHQAILSKTTAASDLVSIEDVMWKEQTGQPLTIEDRVNGATWIALQTKANKRVKTLRGLWTTYAEYRGIEERDKIHLKKRWEKFMSIIGDKTLNATPLGHQALSVELNAALRQYRDTRLTTVKGATVRRELNDIKACLMHSSEENDFDWHLSKIKISKAMAGTVKVKKPLSLEHQKKLAAYVTSPEHCKEPTSTMALLYLQGGVMFSEAGRFNIEAQIKNLAHEDTPYVSIEGLTKTEARQRVVPVVIGVGVVRQGIKDTVEWIGRVPHATMLNQMKAMLKKATGCNDYSSHCLRHTFSWNCSHNGNVRDIDKINIGGWSAGSAGVNTKVSMKYGAANLGGTEQLINLHKASREIHKHLLVLNSPLSIQVHTADS